jgi:hypothetical protein
VDENRIYMQVRALVLLSTAFTGLVAEAELGTSISNKAGLCIPSCKYIKIYHLEKEYQSQAIMLLYKLNLWGYEKWALVFSFTLLC